MPYSNMTDRAFPEKGYGENEIEPKIYDALKILNEKGYTTTNSCEGHKDAKTNQAMAEELHREYPDKDLKELRKFVENQIRVATNKSETESNTPLYVSIQGNPILNPETPGDSWKIERPRVIYKHGRKLPERGRSTSLWFYPSGPGIIPSEAQDVKGRRELLKWAKALPEADLKAERKQDREERVARSKSKSKSSRSKEKRSKKE